MCLSIRLHLDAAQLKDEGQVDSSFLHAEGHVAVAKDCEADPCTKRGTWESTPKVFGFQPTNQRFGKGSIPGSSEILAMVQPQVQSQTPLCQDRMGSPSLSRIHFQEIQAFGQSLVKNICLGSKPFSNFLVRPISFRQVFGFQNSRNPSTDAFTCIGFQMKTKNRRRAVARSPGNIFSLSATGA